MAIENVQLSTPVGLGDRIAADQVAIDGVPVKFQLVQLVTGEDGGTKTLVTGANGLPVVVAPGTTFGAIQTGEWSTRMLDGSGDALVAKNSAPWGMELGLIVRNIPSGTQVISGVVSVLQDGPWAVSLLGVSAVTDKPAATGGLTVHPAIVSAASTNAQVIKNSGGQIYNIQAFNLSSSPRWLKIFDKATAPTVGTDTPIKNLLIPGNNSGAGLVPLWDKGIQFSNGIAIAITAGIALLDSTVVGANEVSINIDYK